MRSKGYLRLKVQILKKSVKEIQKEEAHGGSGSRILYIHDKQTPSERIQGMTHGWLPAGKIFDWHNHSNIEEVMYVLKGSGKVHDRDGEYDYEPGDVFIFPADIEHKIENNSEIEHEFVFVRIYV
jgi:quercetin dioxygenase-like cupin family protein